MKFNPFADLGKRLYGSIGIVAILILLLIFSTYSFVSVFVVLAFSTMAAVGVWEYARLANSKGIYPSTALMIGIAVSEIVAFFIAHKWIHSKELPVFIMAVGLGLLFLNRFRKSQEALIHVAVEFFGVVYIAVPLSYMLAILYPIEPSTVFDGRWLLFYLIAVTKITDIGAYFIGRLLGKIALAPTLSPKKTVEGAIAGLISALVFSSGIVFFGKMYAGETFPLSYSDAIWLSLLIGVFGQIGDLAESLLKRDAHVKDSNRIPGLGGILDMIDSLIFTAPIVYYYLQWVTLS